MTDDTAGSDIFHCPKAPGCEKAATPEQTIGMIERRLAGTGLRLLSEARRIDAGRLGIPVYMSVYGEDARGLVPCRAQMGKGASPRLARASALMEIVERFSFFSFARRLGSGAPALRWSEAQKKIGERLVSASVIAASVNEQMDEKMAARLLDLAPWHFCEALDLHSRQKMALPFDWFRQINEYNGASAGNCAAESILQGLCELFERHVCARITRERPGLPTLRPGAQDHAELAGLIAPFRREGITLLLKDFSLGLPVPTVGALAYDPATFPHKSEIVYTAGTASSPAGAAMRAITEIAQLGGDFCTGSCYEASGLPKFGDLSQIAWLMDGPETALASLPDISGPDIGQELERLVRKMEGQPLYAIDTSHPGLGISATYCVAPGFDFRERDECQSLGLFIGRRLAGLPDRKLALEGLEKLGKFYPDAHFLPFFRGLVALGHNEPAAAREHFLHRACLEAAPGARAMARFYAGYAACLCGEWAKALPDLAEAAALCPETREYHSQLGLARYRQGDYEGALAAFARASGIDRGSATDHANMGICHRRLGENAKAASCLARALRLDPGLDFARRNYDELLAGWPSSHGDAI